MICLFAYVVFVVSCVSLQVHNIFVPFFAVCPSECCVFFFLPMVLWAFSGGAKKKNAGGWCMYGFVEAVRYCFLGIVFFTLHRTAKVAAACAVVVLAVGGDISEFSIKDIHVYNRHINTTHRFMYLFCLFLVSF